MGVRWSRMAWSEKNELWERWRRGESLGEIARALHRGSSSIYDFVGAEGGIAPPPRRRSRLALTTTEREEISRQLARGRSLRVISTALRRAPSTICREVARNNGRTVRRASRNARDRSNVRSASVTRQTIRAFGRRANATGLLWAVSGGWSPE